VTVHRTYVICRQIRKEFKKVGARTNVVGSGAMLQAGRARVLFQMKSMKYFHYIILPFAPIALRFA
jgi:hypothetical protein